MPLDPRLHLTPLPALSDNYIWLVADDTGDALVVDPGDAGPVQDALDARGWRLRAILLTHHHADHIGGVDALLAHHDASVHAPVDERIEGHFQRVRDGDRVRLDRPSCSFQVLDVPGHTRSHVAYAGHGMLFCGDTLFSLGCGRLFEGTPAQMLASLDRLRALPGDTLVCCAHEYTQANAAFARTVDPDNPALARRSEEIDRLREQGRAHGALHAGFGMHLQPVPAGGRSRHRRVGRRPGRALPKRAFRGPARGQGRVQGMIRRQRFLPVLGTLALLAACSTPPPRPTPPAAPAHPSSAVAPVVPPPAEPTPEPTDLWSRMRARFAMPGCDADPGITAWAARFTRRPRAFERYLGSVTPTIAYIDRAARDAHLPAEFSLLPWVESRYRAEPPRGHRSAGMWQIVPAAAHTLGLPMGRDYDARLDRIVSTPAVMRMLRGYHDRWQDWRLADMAFNAGPYRIRRLHSEGPAPEQPAIPELDVSPITHDHLTKLLAMACVIRDPARFHVKLPPLAPERRLQEVALSRPSTLADVARAAHAPLARVRHLNAGYLHGRMPGEGPWHLLLPAAAAKRLRLAIADGTLPRQPATYTVAAGDSLWRIARRHDLSVRQLRELNGLHGSVVHPGQVLRIESRD